MQKNIEVLMLIFNRNKYLSLSLTGTKGEAVHGHLLHPRDDSLSCGKWFFHHKRHWLWSSSSVQGRLGEYTPDSHGIKCSTLFLSCQPSLYSMLRSTLVHCIWLFSFTVILQLDAHESAELSKTLHCTLMSRTKASVSAMSPWYLLWNAN